VNAQGRKKKGILLVTFGTSIAKAQLAFDNIDTQVSKAFPDNDIHWAYTSKFIRKKLKKQGKIIDSPAQALANMAEEGYTHVAVQSLHMMPGEEYDNLVKTVMAFNDMPKGIKVALTGVPLMYKHKDMQTFASIMLENISKERKGVDAVVFMGHGTHHHANIYYPGLQYYISKIDKDVFLGIVELIPLLEDILPSLKANKYKKILLVPLMSVAGDHAVNDMSGDEEDSWKSQLEKEGFKVESLLKGMAEYNNIVEIWIKHLRDVYKKL
jgi:sirohydrochlorin cobaltochelatase